MELTEKLILAVRCQPILYSKNHEDHCKKHLVLKAWEKVAVEAGVDVKECQKYWRSLRDGFLREKRSQLAPKSGSAAVKDKKPWKWFAHMLFLSKHVSSRPTQSNFESPLSVEVGSGEMPQDSRDVTQEIVVDIDGQALLDSSDETCQVDEAPYQSTSSETCIEITAPSQKKRKISRGETAKSEFEDDLIKIIGKEQDPDEAFCLGLAGDLKKLSNEKRSFIKFKVQELLFKVSTDRIPLD